MIFFDSVKCIRCGAFNWASSKYCRACEKSLDGDILRTEIKLERRREFIEKKKELSKFKENRETVNDVSEENQSCFIDEFQKVPDEESENFNDAYTNSNNYSLSIDYLHIKYYRGEIESFHQRINEFVFQCKGRHFENFLELFLQDMGYVIFVTQLSKDKGADLILYCHKSEKKIAVQAKRYKDNLGVKAIYEALGGMNYYKCDHAMVITTANFTEEACKYSSHVDNVELWNGTKLQKLISQYINENNITKYLRLLESVY